jgi:membrane-bound lytic murein transglycosylase MltF
MYGQKVSREAFLKSIIYIESSGIHQRANGQMVTSSCGALGFMQLMPNTARGLGVNPRDPAQNIQGGSKYFNTIFNRGTVGSKSGLDKIIMAGCAYNMGPYSSKLKQPWSSFLASSNISKGPKMYGLKVKMCLGIELKQNERRFVQQHMARGKSVDEYARNLYSYAHGIGR